MKEKVKVIIGLIAFIFILIAIVIFLNSKNDASNNSEKMSSTKQEAIELQEKDFKKEVLDSDKKVLVDFYATWCGPCKKMKPIIEEIAEEHSEIKVVEIDIDKNDELANKYGVQSIPTFIVIEDGKEINRLVGTTTKANILSLCGDK